MSADAWRVCPSCRAGIYKEKKELAARARAVAEEAYGKVSVEEYRTLEARAFTAEEVLDQDARLNHVETLREDYEIRTEENGKFFVSYHCHCRGCGFKHSFRHEEMIPFEPASPPWESQ